MIVYPHQTNFAGSSEGQNWRVKTPEQGCSWKVSPGFHLVAVSFNTSPTKKKKKMKSKVHHLSIKHNFKLCSSQRLETRPPRLHFHLELWSRRLQQWLLWIYEETSTGEVTRRSIRECRVPPWFSFSKVWYCSCSVARQSVRMNWKLPTLLLHKIASTSTITNTLASF